MDWWELAALGFAIGIPVEIWLKPGGLLEGPREWVIAWGSSIASADRLSRKDRLRLLVAELAQCGFCLTRWSAILLTIMLVAPSLWTAPPWRSLLRLPIYAMAAVRISDMLTTFMHPNKKAEE
jgi:hypothetical protein